MTVDSEDRRAFWVGVETADHLDLVVSTTRSASLDEGAIPEVREGMDATEG